MSRRGPSPIEITITRYGPGKYNLSQLSLFGHGRHAVYIRGNRYSLASAQDRTTIAAYEERQPAAEASR
ncbi:hypothetical protein K6U06_06475 [Acidiferrimicrobium sp. IK]|uniref:hypothetical protein n=1 Tax=Acidiferrimicrobium sp. IK TaxID=2871700 RepID=UPI0021CAFACD|nr:hypothetical protein [Acidiferrimicrobium sp. IK]MCU4183998.1 hypothetical protein [Acidiferrimicrobium sp. IK]